MITGTKVCPLCGASCFEDMGVCYCCMHRFDGEEVAGEALLSEGYVTEVSEPEEDDALEVDVCEVEEEEAAQEHLVPQKTVLLDPAKATSEPLEGNPGKPTCFAFGPTIELLGDVGDCIRIDIPLRAISSVLEAARAYTANQTIDLPPAA